MNQRFVTEHFPGEDPIGRRIRFPVRELAPGRVDAQLIVERSTRALGRARRSAGGTTP